MDVSGGRQHVRHILTYKKSRIAVDNQLCLGLEVLHTLTTLPPYLNSPCLGLQLLLGARAARPDPSTSGPILAGEATAKA